MIKCNGDVKMPSNKNISFISLNYNGKDILATCLPSLFQAIEFDGGDHEVIVVDNGSSDGSVEFVERNFPDAKIVALDENKMIPGGYNAGSKKANNEVLVLLNNDMTVNEDFIERVVRHFDVNSNLFAVVPKMLRWDRSTICGGKRQGKIIKGFFVPYGECDNEPDKGQLDEVSYVLTAELAAYERRKLIEIGNLDVLFPLNFAFIDLSYRAWKRGYHILFEPEGIIYHIGSVTVNKFLTQSDIAYITERERFLFMWKNFNDHKLLVDHFVNLPLHLLKTLVKQDFTSQRSFIEALRKLGEIRKRRSLARFKNRRSDKEVFELTTGEKIY